MPNPQEIDPETREAMEALGFEKTPDGNYYKRDTRYWVWAPGSWTVNPEQWLGDPNATSGELLVGDAGQLFDDPISAAVWLNVEASHG